MKLPNYNYHSHTFLCGHASFVSNSKYILKYRNNNIKCIGISDHMPNTKYALPEEKIRMDITHLNKYLKNIKKLKRKNKDLNILIGLECEYSKILGKHLSTLKNKCDYLILGQHYVDDITPINNVDYPLIYANMVCEAMDTGLFSYIAHPDYFLRFRDTVNDIKKYMENAKKAFELICKKAKNLNIPLEINLNNINNVRIMKDNEYPYPHSLFLNCVRKNGNKCVIGIDAHNPNVIDKYNNSLNKIYKMLDGINVLYEYNPITDRNTILDKKYNIFKKNIKSFKYYYLKNILKKVPYNASNKEIINTLNELKHNLFENKNKIIKSLKSEINTINNSIIDINDKKKMIKRKKQFIKLTNKRYKKQNRLLTSITKKTKKLKNKYQNKRLINKLKKYYS